MTPTRLLQRQLRPPAWLSPGQYTTASPSGRPVLSCPECHGVSEIEQTPLKDGSVPLLWACPFACPYQAYLRLEDWLEQVLA